LRLADDAVAFDFDNAAAHRLQQFEDEKAVAFLQLQAAAAQGIAPEVEFHKT